METGTQRIFLKRTICGVVLIALLQSVIAIAADVSAEQTPQVIKPQVERRSIHIPDIDDENVEVGLYAGILSIENFGTNPIYGVRLAYHIAETVFIEANYARSKGSKTSIEQVEGNLSVLTDDQRKLSYYNLLLGYNIFPGEAFIGKKHAFTTDLYLQAGIGSTTFGGNSHVTYILGSGYRLLITDWLALHIDARDNIFTMDIFAESATTHNLEFTTGFTAFF